MILVPLKKDPDILLQEYKVLVLTGILGSVSSIK